MDFARTFFVTTITYKRYDYFRDFTKARRFFRVLYDYRRQGKFLIHAFILMPDHLHIILTPAENISLEKAMQFIKGGSSFQMSLAEKLWQPSFSNHRIRDANDLAIHVGYIEKNPVKARLAECAAKYPLCSAYPGRKLDEIPSGAEAPF
ncbi:MAG TPA: transposase [Terriglobales bacterium]|nr:transposase [Terriglobales bacterium]